MSLSAIPKYLRIETRRLIDSALEQAWQELKEDVPADIALAGRSLPERSSRWGTARNTAYATTFAKRRTLYARRT
jgi:hypothetical protein